MVFDLREAREFAASDVAETHIDIDIDDVGVLAERPAKRAFDIVFASLALIVALPALAVLIVAVRLSSPGPAIYRPLRVGHHGRVFHCFKLRTMVMDADIRLTEVLDHDPKLAEEFRKTQKLRRDPRVTWVGTFLRKTSLDELPQLVNVLRGEMSIVGWRPLALQEPHRYGLNFDIVCQARPGITGLWQTSGRSNLSYAERVELDVSYVRHWSFVQDATIIAKTIRQLIPWGEHGAY
jgi:exopolysaccharide production protein ExoY